MAGDKALSVKEHEEEWDEILNNVNEMCIRDRYKCRSIVFVRLCIFNRLTYI